MRLPVDTKRYGFTFGQIYPPGWGSLSGKPHLGLDLIAPIGTDIVAPEDGEVVWTGNGSVGGRTIHFLGISGVFHRMLHCKDYEKRDIYLEGEVIGHVGNTGLSTAPHCHYDKSRNGKLELHNFSNFTDPQILNGSAKLYHGLSLAQWEMVFGWWYEALGESAPYKDVGLHVEGIKRGNTPAQALSGFTARLVEQGRSGLKEEITNL